jgi:hypothetical protein
MAKQLRTNVHVDGKGYGPDYPDNELSADVAKQIDNPKAWDDYDPSVPLRPGESDNIEGFAGNEGETAKVDPDSGLTAETAAAQEQAKDSKPSEAAKRAVTPAKK